MKCDSIFGLLSLIAKGVDVGIFCVQMGVNVDTMSTGGKLDVMAVYMNWMCGVI